MNSEIKQKIKSLVSQNSVVLFMKGTKDQPQCGFSKQVVGVLKQLTRDFVTIDVLADPDMRDGIKVYSSWPTIPQLYIDGEFIGGCDIVLKMFSENELQPLLKVARSDQAPHVTLSDAALAAFKDANAERAEEEHFRLSIGADFEHGLSFDFKHEDDFSLIFGDVEIIIDPYSAARAEGLRIDFVRDGLESGFAFENPQDPPLVEELPAEELKAWLLQHKDVLLLDVRPRFEWEKAHIASAHLLEEMSKEALSSLKKDQCLVFFCHHGGRSRRTAESWRLRGFTKLFNLTGGIDAWSRKVDANVPIYTK